VRLAPRERRAVTAGLSIVLGVLLLLRIIPASVRAILALDGRVEQQRGLLSRIDSDIRESPALEDSASSVLDRFRRLAAQLLPGASDAEAAAEVAHRIEVEAVRAGLRMLETTPVADTTRVVRLHRVSLRAVLDGDLRGLMAALRALERDTVVITVVALRLVANDAAAQEGQPESLRAEILVRGWYSVGNAPAQTRTAVR
jgi:hypothetical protein